MKDESFVKLYTSNVRDESFTPLENSAGFTLIRKYDKNSEYFKDDKRMFIRLYLSDGAVRGGIDMVYSREDGALGGYRIDTDNKYKKKVTNFSLDKEEDLSFKENKIFYRPKKIYFTVNDFVDILIKNHLQDRLFWKRQLKMIVGSMLMFLFWLSDKHYDKVSAMLYIHNLDKQKQHDKSDEKNIEPFFKYFYISRNILFTLLLIALPASLIVSYFLQIKYLSLSNPPVVLFFFLALFVFEKLSISLDKKNQAIF